MEAISFGVANGQSCGSGCVHESLPELVERAKHGSSSAFAQLIRRYERAALAIAYSAAGDSDSAGDVVQEAFVRAWRKLATLKDPARFGSWLAGIIRNVAVDQRRRSRRNMAEDLRPD